MRAFLALDLPEGVIGPVTALQAGLEAGRPVAQENLHLTLAFLGDLSEPQVAALAEALLDFTAPPVPLRLAGADLARGRVPNLIWIGADRDPALLHLQSKVETLVRNAGVPLERRRFRPHVTLARFPKVLSARDQRAIGEFLALNGAVRLPEAMADRVTLYESHLRDDGALYLPLAEAELTG